MQMALRWLLPVLLVALAACSFTQPAPVKETFLLRAGDVPVAPKSHPGALKVVDFRVAPPFQNRGLVYRVDDLRYESDFYNQFFIFPDAMITNIVAERLGQAKPFEVILPPSSRLDAPYRLHGLVTELYGDVRDKSRPAAVLAIQFYLSRSGTDQVIYDQTLKQRVSLADASPESLVRGLSTALQQILAELGRQLQALGSPSGPS
jgi:cholesterol transport system auxiliary component